MSLSRHVRAIDGLLNDLLLPAAPPVLGAGQPAELLLVQQGDEPQVAPPAVQAAVPAVGNVGRHGALGAWEADT